MIPAREALERLRDGNRRFVANVRSHESLASEARRAEVAAGQEPFAIILGCSDSRVPAEIVFDQGLGDLFVIRVAVTSSRRRRWAASSSRPDDIGTRLVVVLGHSQCGAILATIDQLHAPDRESVKKPALDRRPHPSVGRAAAGDRHCTHDLRGAGARTPFARTSACRRHTCGMGRKCSSS